jgi:hypothetical protein
MAKSRDCRTKWWCKEWQLISGNNLISESKTKVLFDKELIVKDSFIAKLKERVNLDVSDENLKKELLKEIARYYSTA